MLKTTSRQSYVHKLFPNVLVRVSWCIKNLQGRNEAYLKLCGTCPRISLGYTTGTPAYRTTLLGINPRMGVNYIESLVHPRQTLNKYFPHSATAVKNSLFGSARPYSEKNISNHLAQRFYRHKLFWTEFYNFGFQGTQ